MVCMRSGRMALQPWLKLKLCAAGELVRLAGGPGIQLREHERYARSVTANHVVDACVQAGIVTEILISNHRLEPADADHFRKHVARLRQESRSVSGSILQVVVVEGAFKGDDTLSRKLLFDKKVEVVAGEIC